MEVYEIVSLVLAGLITIAFIWYLLSRAKESRKPLSERVDRVRRELVSGESKTGKSELMSGYYPGVSDEMLREVAEAEGFRFVGKVHRTLTFQRTVVGDGNDAL